MILVVLASGRGKRLKEKTKIIPKCLVLLKKNLTILDEIEKSFYLFDRVIIVAGYKGHLLKKRYKKNNIKVIINKKFLNTNMVYSLFLARKYINSDVVITYSDIIYDIAIIKKLIKLKKTVLPLNINWLKLWRMRMNNKKILQDAESVKVKSNYITHIGGKILDNNYPKYQFMGLCRITFDDFRAMYLLFKKIKNIKIDFTRFLNIFLQLNKVYFFKTRKFWFEFDTKADLNIFKKYFLK